MPKVQTPSTYGKRRLYHSALFVVVSGNQKRITKYDIPRVHETMMVLHLMARKEGNLYGETTHTWQEAISAISSAVLERLKKDGREGRIPIPGPPLSTITARKKGHRRKLFESGQLLDAMTVKPLPLSQTALGRMGFRIAVDTRLREDAWHQPNWPMGKPIPMNTLYNIVTRTGAVIDLTNPKVRKAVFGFYRALGLLDDDEERRWEDTGKKYIFIPPRPLFTQEYMGKLARLATRKMHKTVTKHMQVLAKEWEGGAWMAKSKEQLLAVQRKAILTASKEE